MIVALTSTPPSSAALTTLGSALDSKLQRNCTLLLGSGGLGLSGGGGNLGGANGSGGSSLLGLSLLGGIDLLSLDLLGIDLLDVLGVLLGILLLDLLLNLLLDLHFLDAGLLLLSLLLLGQLLLSLLVAPLVVQLLVFSNGGLSLLVPVALLLLDQLLATKASVSDDPLDLGSLLPLASSGGLLRSEGPPDSVLLHEGFDVLTLLQTEQLSDTGNTLGTKTPGLSGIGEAWDFLLALLDEHEGQGTDVRADDATANGLALPLSGTPGTIAAGAGLEQQSDTVAGSDSLLHGETILVVASGDLEDVALEVVAKGIGFDLLADALVEEDAALVIVVDLKAFLSALKGVCDVELR